MLKLLITASFLITVLAEDWDRHSLLDTDGKYHLYWTVKEDVIVFQVEVAATGWVGFGISPNGGMTGSDVVIGWVSDRTTTFHDRHAIGKYMPKIDDRQDWELLWSHENDTHTIIRFQRKLNTCDKEEDYVIKGPTTKVIYAYTQEDPASAHSVMYHGRINRGSKSLNLFQEGRENRDLGSPQDLFSWEIRSPHVKLPDDIDTAYLCTIVRRPHLDRKNHIIKVDVAIQPGNVRFVHHMILYECTDAKESDVEPYLGGFHDCYDENQVPRVTFCFSPVSGWATGGEALYLPEYTGFPFGAKNSVYYMLEVHYDNPGYESGIVDNSGLRLTYTPKLRKYDSAGLLFGNLWYACMFIPPKQKDFIVSGHAHPSCLRQVIPPEGINIYGILLHTHIAGRKVRVRHFRNKQELAPIISDDNYDFNYQTYVMLPEEVKLLPIDHVIVECTYDTSNREETTFGGLSIQQEMCLALAIYYPQVSLAIALSCPSPMNLVKVLGVTQMSDDDRFLISPISGKNESYVDFLNTYPWDGNSVSAVQKAMKYSPHLNMCADKGGIFRMVVVLPRYPDGANLYKESDECVTQNSQGFNFKPYSASRDPVPQILPSYVSEKI